MYLPVDSEEQGKGSDSFLSSGEVGHRLEPFAWSNTVVVNPLEKGFLRVFRPEERLGGLVPRQCLVDPVDGVAHVLKALVEEVVAFLLHALELHLGLLCPLADAVEVLVCLLELLPRLLQLLHCLHVRRLDNTRVR